MSEIDETDQYNFVDDVCNGELEDVTKYVLKYGSKALITEDGSERLPLVWAIIGGHQPVIDFFLSENKAVILPHINKSSNQPGCTPLTAAVSREDGPSPESMRKLLHCGANVEVEDQFGNTPLKAVVDFDHADCLQVLLDSGAISLEIIPNKTEEEAREMAQDDNAAAAALIKWMDAQRQCK
uniref:Uncharacterized protein n=1 Tax=Chromera velia CCMP2878 TaxID=1169474 RepID=A0A0G4HP19_9ALVE|eukprot:Cvel_29809.t1-p1 / transcript=Cvel_29809.t1 / gene=Cvel_29809 / organism=Chromera_velia_CCMP2878 / gene_product=Fibronectin type 3 and ankyrin repeat domains 1, putative / transcript_product=Fibronectin type 3 and ankyrin repeat domains 1, putative / location=Cvel_scaffold4148:8043-8585(+) / protein_length=181 / sequence_SO=supercontig / SO=protein_coding / is_pseudo=false